MPFPLVVAVMWILFLPLDAAEAILRGVFPYILVVAVIAFVLRVVRNARNHKSWYGHTERTRAEAEDRYVKECAEAAARDAVDDRDGIDEDTP